MTVVGILVCDHLDGDLRKVAGGDIGDLYVRLLSDADPELETRLYHPVDGELPPAEACDAWIITGSRADAHGDVDWIVKLRGWVAAAAPTGRIAGVCFGHQLVAHALGGRAERASGWRVGPFAMTVETTPWFDGATVTVNAMHRDEVTALPAGARRIASGGTADVAAFAIDDRILCIQDHPEFSNELTAALITRRTERVGPDVAADGLARAAAVPTDGPQVGEWLAAFLADRRH